MQAGSLSRRAAAAGWAGASQGRNPTMGALQRKLNVFFGIAASRAAGPPCGAAAAAPKPSLLTCIQMLPLVSNSCGGQATQLQLQGTARAGHSNVLDCSCSLCVRMTTGQATSVCVASSVAVRQPQKASKGVCTRMSTGAKAVRGQGLTGGGIRVVEGGALLRQRQACVGSVAHKVGL